MALVTFVEPVPRDIPHEPDQWMMFRRPASRHVRAARRLVEAEGRQGVRDFGADIVKALNEGDDDEKALRRLRRFEAEQEYHPSMFDRDTLLQAAIVSWSYVDPKTGQPVPVTPESIGDLDEATARWAHALVVDLMKPPTAEQEKNG